MLRNIHKDLYLLAICIFADVVCDNLIVQTYSDLSFRNEKMSLIFITGFVTLYLVLQIIIAPFQSGLSDFYCRKKSLITALIFTLGSLTFTYLYDAGIFATILGLFIILLLKSYGNITPISWAAIADVQKKELRFALGIATSPYALSYIILGLFNRLSKKTSSDLIIWFFILVIIIYVIKFFTDPNDIEKRKKRIDSSPLKKISTEKRAIFKDFRDKIILTGLLGYLCWSIALYIMLVILVDFGIAHGNAYAIHMMYGYFIGVLILKFCDKVSDNHIISLGYIVTLVPLILYFFLKDTTIKHSLLINIPCVFTGMGNAYLTTAMLTILSKERKIHEQGRVFGLVESIDTFGFWLATLIVLFYKIFKPSIHFLIFTSIFIFVLSLIPYLKNVKMRSIRQKS